jgi:hypothetical protein
MAVEADVVENESGKTLNHVQNGLNLQLNSWSPVRGLALFCNWHLTRTSGDQLFGFTTLDILAPSMGGSGELRRRLPNSSSRRRRSLRVTDSPAPAHRRALDVRKEIAPPRKSLPKSGKVPIITHKKCYRYLHEYFDDGISCRYRPKAPAYPLTEKRQETPRPPNAPSCVHPRRRGVGTKNGRPKNVILTVDFRLS